MSVLAGGVAGTSIDFVLYPVDSIKTRLQASSTKKDFVKSAESVSKFKGLASAMAASFPCAATFWATYELSKYVLRGCGVFNLTFEHMLAGSIAELTQAFIRSPFEVVK